MRPVVPHVEDVRELLSRLQLQEGGRREGSVINLDSDDHGQSAVGRVRVGRDLDRDQSALDRVHAGRDRDAAAADRAVPIEASRRAGQRREAAAAEHRVDAALDRMDAEADRVGAAKDRESAAGDRGDVKNMRHRAAARGKRVDKDAAK